MPDIVISEFMDEAAVARLRERFDTFYDPGLVDRAGDLAASLADARALIVRNRTRVDQALLKAAPGLEVVGRLGVGLDNIDTATCAARGVLVRPATGANVVSVAEYVIAAALHLARPAYGANAEMLAGKWPRQALVGGELGGRTLGLVGYGAIAREVARRALAFDMAVVGHDPFLAPGDPGWGETRALGLPELLARADVVSLHVPLTAATRNMIDAAAIARMKPGAILVNTARGGVVDEAALALALKESRLGGAALDVFETEPLTADAAAGFAGIANMILTPHIAGVTEESNVRVSAVTADAVLAVLGG